MALGIPSNCSVMRTLCRPPPDGPTTFVSRTALSHMRTVRSVSAGTGLQRAALLCLPCSGLHPAPVPAHAAANADGVVAEPSGVIGYEAKSVYKLLTVRHESGCVLGVRGVEVRGMEKGDQGCGEEGGGRHWRRVVCGAMPRRSHASPHAADIPQDPGYLADWTYGTDFQFLCLGTK